MSAIHCIAPPSVHVVKRERVKNAQNRVTFLTWAWKQGGEGIIREIFLSWGRVILNRKEAAVKTIGKLLGIKSFDVEKLALQMWLLSTKSQKNDRSKENAFQKFSEESLALRQNSSLRQQRDLDIMQGLSEQMTNSGLMRLVFWSWSQGVGGLVREYALRQQVSSMWQHREDGQLLGLVFLSWARVMASAQVGEHHRRVMSHHLAAAVTRQTLGTILSAWVAAAWEMQRECSHNRTVHGLSSVLDPWITSITRQLLFQIVSSWSHSCVYSKSLELTWAYRESAKEVQRNGQAVARRMTLTTDLYAIASAFCSWVCLLSHSKELNAEASECITNFFECQALRAHVSNQDSKIMAMETVEEDLVGRCAETQQQICGLREELAHREKASEELAWREQTLEGLQNTLSQELTQQQETSDGLQHALMQECSEVRAQSLEWNAVQKLVSDQKSELAAMTAQKFCLSEGNADLLRTIDSLSSEMRSKLTQESHEVIAQKQECSAVEELLSDQKTKVAAMTAQHSELRDRNAELQQTIYSLRMRMQLIQTQESSEAQAQKLECGAFEELLSDQRTELAAMSTQQSDLRDQNAELQQTLNHLRMEQKTELAVLTTHQEDLRETNRRTTSELQATIDSLCKKMAQAEETSEGLQRALTEERSQLSSLRGYKLECKEVQKRMSDQEDELAAMIIQKSDLRDRNAELQKTITCKCMQLEAAEESLEKVAVNDLSHSMETNQELREELKQRDDEMQKLRFQQAHNRNREETLEQQGGYLLEMLAQQTNAEHSVKSNSDQLRSEVKTFSDQLKRSGKDIERLVHQESATLQGWETVAQLAMDELKASEHEKKELRCELMSCEGRAESTSREAWVMAKQMDQMQFCLSMRAVEQLEHGAKVTELRAENLALKHSPDKSKSKALQQQSKGYARSSHRPPIEPEREPTGLANRSVPREPEREPSGFANRHSFDNFQKQDVMLSAVQGYASEKCITASPNSHQPTISDKQRLSLVRQRVAELEDRRSIPWRGFRNERGS